jgi:hypothetical protein
MIRLAVSALPYKGREVDDSPADIKIITKP